jgi:hypothetical protein
VDCIDSSVVNLSYLGPLYDIAKTRFDTLPEYRLDKSHFAGITLADVIDKWPAATVDTQILRFQLIRSFIDNCTDPKLGILAKASELKSLYDNFISSAFQNKDRYSANIRFNRQCRQTPKDNAYPLHTGWLMAVAAYNAGPRAVDALAFYNQWNPAAFNDPATVADFMGDKIVESIYWAGKYNSTTDKIDYVNLDGQSRSWPWFTACVAQRHVARVMQNVTLLPEYFVDTLEGQYPCAKSTVDPSGKLQTSVPPVRQISSGTK